MCWTLLKSEIFWIALLTFLNFSDDFAYVFCQLLSCSSPFWLALPFCWPFWISSTHLSPMNIKFFSTTIHLRQTCLNFWLNRPFAPNALKISAQRQIRAKHIDESVYFFQSGRLGKTYLPHFISTPKWRTPVAYLSITGVLQALRHFKESRNFNLL